MAHKLRLCSRHIFLTSILNKSFKNSLCAIKIFKRLRSDDTEAVAVSLTDTFTIQNEFASTKQMKMSSYVSPSIILKELFQKNLKYSGDDMKLQITDVAVEKINDYIMENVYNRQVNLNDLVLKCSECNIKLSNNVILELLHMYSEKADVIMINKLENLYTQAEYDDDKLPLNYFVGLAHWKKGNIDEAFANFNSIFHGNFNSKLKVRLLLQRLITDAIENSSEASVVLIKKHTIHALKVLNERSPILIFWKACMLSKFYRDNQIAINLYNDYEMLRIILDDLLHYYASQALKIYKEDTVIDILQLLLKYDKKYQYSLVIQCLFDYRFREGNLAGCVEIIKNCLELNIKLNNHNQMYKKALELHFKYEDLCKILNRVERDPSHTYRIKF